MYEQNSLEFFFFLRLGLTYFQLISDQKSVEKKSLRGFNLRLP